MRKKIVSKFLIALFNLMSFTVTTQGFGNGKKTWSYELKEVTSTSSDPEKLSIDLKVERISRGVYAISGEVLINTDIVEGDSNKIQAKSFRSSQGDSDFKILPFQMPSTHIFRVLNTHYKEILMPTIKKCSNMPVFENKFEPPLEKKVYNFEACQFSQDGLPNHLQEGFYKLLLIGTGEVDWQVSIIAEVTNDF